MQEPGAPEEEEEPQGVEMEDDFEGDLQDVPEAGQQDQEEGEEAEEDDEQCLEQQMGEGGEGEQVGAAWCYLVPPMLLLPELTSLFCISSRLIGQRFAPS